MSDYDSLFRALEGRGEVNRPVLCGQRGKQRIWIPLIQMSNQDPFFLLGIQRLIKLAHLITV